MFITLVQKRGYIIYFRNSTYKTITSILHILSYSEGLHKLEIPHDNKELMKTFRPRRVKCEIMYIKFIMNLLVLYVCPTLLTIVKQRKLQLTGNVPPVWKNTYL
jgi:hypothetical protein